MLPNRRDPLRKPLAFRIFGRAGSPLDINLSAATGWASFNLALPTPVLADPNLSPRLGRWGVADALDVFRPKVALYRPFAPGGRQPLWRKTA